MQTNSARLLVYSLIIRIMIGFKWMTGFGACESLRFESDLVSFVSNVDNFKTPALVRKMENQLFVEGMGLKCAFI